MISLGARFAIVMARLVRVKRKLSTARLEQTISSDRRDGPMLPSPAMRSKFAITENVVADRKVFTIKPHGATSTQRHILYLHGGGFAMSITELHWDLIGKLASALQVTVTVPLYPLTPEKTATEVYAMLLPFYEQLVKEIGGAEHLTIMGDSAGGNLALSLTMQARDAKLPLPANLVLLSPGVDFSFTDPKQPALDQTDPILDLEGARKLGQMYAGALDVKDPVVSPLYGSFQGLPPMVVFTGTRDLVNPDAHHLQAKAKEAGVPLQLFEYPGMVHVWMLFPMPESTRVINQIVEAIPTTALLR